MPKALCVKEGHMSIVIFDVKTGSNGYIESVNNRILERNPEYSERYGLIGSKKWLDLYASGKISKNVKSGQVSYIGPDRYEPCEEENIIEIETDRRMISYDQEGYWFNSAIELEAWVQIETIKVKIPDKNGSITSLIDVKVVVLK